MKKTFYFDIAPVADMGTIQSDDSSKPGESGERTKHKISAADGLY